MLCYVRRVTRRIAPHELRAGCDPDRLGFASTTELSPLCGIIGQDRALGATAFGIGMKAPGYNLFVVGPPQTGKQSTMRSLIAARAQGEPSPPDLCYVHRFDDTSRPRALVLPAGRGRSLREGMERFVEAAKTSFQRTFESDEFSRRKNVLRERVQVQIRTHIAEAEEAARAEGFSVLHTPESFTVTYAPAGKHLTTEEFSDLPPEERDRVEVRARTLHTRLEPVMRSIRQLEREAQGEHERLVRELGAETAKASTTELRQQMHDLPAVLSFLSEVESDLVDHAERFVRQSEAVDAEDDEEDDSEDVVDDDDGLGFLERYKVNVLVDSSGVTGAPVVSEPSPSYLNLVGRIEHRMQLGVLVTDFMLIKAGALHRANGGYLILEAKDLVDHPFAWDALKKAIKSRTIRIEEPIEELRMLSAASLQPEPMPLAVKVILLGAPALYYLMYELDEDFRELFKVKVNFDDSLVRTPETEQQLGRFVAGCCLEHQLLPCTARAVAKLVEEASRRAEHQGRLSARFGELVDLLREAAYFAGERQAEAIDDCDIRTAVEKKRYRSNLVEEELMRMTDEGVIEIATQGMALGQVNGAAVMALGDHEFGRPVRITARVRPGKPGVTDIEREVGLGGAIHAKGVLILGGYLAGRYAPEHRLAMAASLAAEQSYDEIDGDSASAAELCALLSALGEVPLAQSLALTGAISQTGEIQAVGGVNEKIEGFYDLCRLRGLTGEQGILIPTTNVRHLMLREDVVQAVTEGRFAVYAVATVDEALTLLAGRPAGERDGTGAFPEGSVNARVEARLRSWAERLGGRE